MERQRILNICAWKFWNVFSNFIDFKNILFIGERKIEIEKLIFFNFENIEKLEIVFRKVREIIGLQSENVEEMKRYV